MFSALLWLSNPCRRLLFLSFAFAILFRLGLHDFTCLLASREPQKGIPECDDVMGGHSRGFQNIADLTATFKCQARFGLEFHVNAAFHGVC